MPEHDEKEEHNTVHKVDTVPPPPGEDDAYNAPTRIGPMAEVAVQEMMRQARAAEETAAQSARPPVSRPPRAPSTKPPPPSPRRAEELSSDNLVDDLGSRPDAAPPRIYADEDEAEEEDAETRLHASAKPPPVSFIPNIQVFQPEAAVAPARTSARTWMFVSSILAVSLLVMALVFALSR